MLDKIIDLSITRATLTPSMASFNDLLIVAEHNAFTERIKVYSDLDGVSEDFKSDSFVAGCVGKVFSQNPSINKVYVGRKLSTENWTTCLDAIKAVNNNWYGVVAEARDKTNQSEIADWIEANKKLYITATADSGTKGTTTDDIAYYVKNKNYQRTAVIYDDYAIWKSKIQFAFSEEFVTGNTITITINGIEVEEDFDTDNATTYNNIGQALALTFPNATIVANPTTRIISIEQKGVMFNGTCQITGGESQAIVTTTYPNNKDENFIDGAWFGLMFTKEVGGSNWAYKTLSGVAVSNLTATDITNLEAKNCNFYINISGIPVILFGKVGGNEWIDVIQGIDWLDAKIKAELFTLLVNNEKIPYTDAGIQQVVSVLRACLNNAVSKTILNEDFIITYPKVVDISKIDKGNRHLPDVKFNATLQGAINTIRIQGVVSL